jgi:hypothetical protein
MVKRAEIAVEAPTYLCLANCPFFWGIVVSEEEGDNFNQVFCSAGCSRNGPNPVTVRNVVLVGATCEPRMGHAQVEKLEKAA